MALKSTIIRRIVVLAAALAILIGVAGRSVGAEPIDINSGSATVARGLCVGSGGDWNITNNVFFCTYPGGHGWACDMDTNPIVCWNFLTTAPAGTIKANIGATQIANVQVQPSSSGPVNASVAQASIVNSQLKPVTVATTQIAPASVQVSKRVGVNSVNTSNP